MKLMVVFFILLLSQVSIANDWNYDNGTHDTTVYHPDGSSQTLRQQPGFDGSQYNATITDYSTGSMKTIHDNTVIDYSTGKMDVINEQ